MPLWCWELVSSHVLLGLSEESPIIDEIWSWDAANRGDSALLNKEQLDSLSNTPSSHHSPRYRRVEKVFLGDNVWDVTEFLLNHLSNSVEPSSHPQRGSRKPVGGMDFLIEHVS